MAVKPQIGCRVDVSCAIYQSFCPVTNSLEVTKGTAHALSSKTPTLTSWLTQTQRARRVQHTQIDIWLKLVVHRFQTQGCAGCVHCQAERPVCDLQAGFDKVATCVIRLFLTGEETPWKLTSWSSYSQTKDNTFTRGEVPLIGHFMITLDYYIHLVEAFIQSDLQWVQSTVRIQLKNRMLLSHRRQVMVSWSGFEAAVQDGEEQCDVGELG